MTNDVLKLFEGLTQEQVKQMRREIVPTLETIRNKILSDSEVNMQDLKAQLTDLKARKDKIKANADLSTEGKRKQLAALDKEAEAVKASALNSLTVSWRNVRGKYADLEKRKAEAEDKAAAAWDYNRLNYAARSVESAVNKAADIREVGRMYADVLKSGDKHARRAWGEHIRSETLKRWNDTPEARDLQRKAEADLTALLDTPELEAVRSEGANLTDSVMELAKVTREVSDYFYPPVGLPVPNEFSRLLEGVDIRQKLHADTGKVLTTVEIAEGVL